MSKNLAKLTPASTLAEFHEKTLKIWQDEKQIRALFAPSLTDQEFKFFVGLGIALGANPFNREIWAVKYGSNPASIFCGRDFYRRKAQEHPEYQNHLSEAIYTNDAFKVLNGEVQHEYNLSDRGKLLGAYCLVWRKNALKPFFVRVTLSEYSTGQSTWKQKPETMIKKVAESQALRGAFQGLFAGTYDESEKWQEATVIETSPASSELPDPEDYIHPKELRPVSQVVKNGRLYHFNIARQQYEYCEDVDKADTPTYSNLSGKAPAAEKPQANQPAAAQENGRNGRNETARAGSSKAQRDVKQKPAAKNGAEQPQLF